MHMSGFKTTIQSFFIPTHSKLNFAVSMISALTAIIAVLIALYLHINPPFWAMTTVFALTASNRSIILYKSPRRLVATITGCITALGIAMIFSSLPLLGLVMVFFISFSGFYLSRRLPENYLLLFFTIHVFMFGSVFLFDPNSAFSLMVGRILDNILGITLVVFIFCCLFHFLMPPQSIHSPKVKDHISAIHYSAIMLISSILALCAWYFFDIPGGALNMIVTIVIISEIQHESIMNKGQNRLWGCLCGIVAGVIVLLISTFSITAMFILFFAIATAFMYYSLQHPKFGYAGLQAAVVLAIISFPHLNTEISMQEGLYRALGIFIGLIIIILIHPIYMRLFKIRT